MIRRSSLIALEIVLGLMAALIIGVGVAWWRLSQGPVELSFLNETVQSELSEARSGRPVGIDRVELAWTRQSALELRAVGVRVEDGRGRVLSRSQEARIELGVLPLLIGRVSIVGAEFIGGEISITHKIDGATEIAFGPPGSPPDIILPRSEDNETLEQKVNRALDSLARAFRPVGPGGRLRLVAARNAKLTIVDNQGGGRWTADAANLELRRDGQSLALLAQARLEGLQGQAPATLRITTDTRFQSAIVEFGANGVRPRALFSQAALGPFGGLDAPFTATVSIGLDRHAGINRFEGDATLGRGTAEMAGGHFAVSGGHFHGRYDLDSDEVIIDELQLAGDHTRINGEAHIRDASRIMRAAANQPAAFDIALPSLRLDVPGTFSSPVALTDVQVQGTIDSGGRSIRFSRLHARAEDAVAEATGRFYWGEAGPDHKTYPGLELHGVVNGVADALTVLHVWPMQLGEHAHHFLVDSLLAGRVTEGRADLDLRPSDFAADRFRNEAIDVRFNVTNGTFRFLDTMSPITNARGSGILRGNSFELTVPEARINGLAVTNGRVDINQLRPDGGVATISAHAEGDARNALEILMQEPLALRDRIPVDPASAAGHASVNLRLARPMLEEVPIEDWRYNVDGSISNFTGRMTSRPMLISNGQLRVVGDQRAFHITGPVRAGTSNVNVAWTEYINRPSNASSEYQISGDFDAADLVRLGYDVAEYARGRVGVSISGQGRGFDVDNAHIEIDARNAQLDSPWSFWTKAAGVTAAASLDVVRQRDGGLLIDNIDARGSGLVARGRVRLARDNSIQLIDLPRLAIDGHSDAHLVLQHASDGGTDVTVTGSLFDGAPFMEDQRPPFTTTRPTTTVVHTDDPPMRASVTVDALKLRGGATLANARVRLSTTSGALQTLVAEGVSPGEHPFSLAVGPRPTDPAGHIRFRADDAGFAVRALTGAENIVGGNATADGDWRVGPPSQARFTVRLRDFQVVRLPAMAHLLSSVGSLTGLVETLNGDGIGFNALDAQMVYVNDRLTFTEGRMAGPSLGFTAAGSYDINHDNLDVDGVVVPSYGLNSFLGNLPLLGDLFVSRRGEGIFGMTYSVNGPAGTPRVGVNPVSIVTPGILRRIFEPVPQRSHAPTTPAPAPQPATPPAALAPSSGVANQGASLEEDATLAQYTDAPPLPPAQIAATPVNDLAVTP